MSQPNLLPPLLQERDPADSLGSAFKLVFKAFGSYVLPMLLFALPFMVAEGLATLFMAQAPTNAMGIPEGPWLGVTALAQLLNMSAVMLMVGAQLRFHHETGRFAKLGELMGYGPRVFAIAVALVLVVLATALGFMFLIVPGVIVLVLLSVSALPIVWEDASATKALSRSWALVKTQFWNTFLYLILAVLVSGMSMIILAPLAFAFTGGIGVLSNPGEAASSNLLGYSLFVGSNLLVGFVVSSITNTGLALHYFNLLKKEEQAEDSLAP